MLNHTTRANIDRTGARSRHAQPFALSLSKAALSPVLGLARKSL